MKADIHQPVELQVSAAENPGYRMLMGWITLCTRILWNDNGTAVVTARTMDWPVPTDPVLTVFPRGSRHDGGVVGGKRVVEGMPCAGRPFTGPW